METAPFRTLCAMTLVAGVSRMQMVQDRNGGAARPLEDVFEDEDRPALEAISATLEGKTEKQKTPIPKAPSPSPLGYAHASADGQDSMENPGPSSCSTAFYQFRAIQRGYTIASVSRYLLPNKRLSTSRFGAKI